MYAECQGQFLEFIYVKWQLLEFNINIFWCKLKVLGWRNENLRQHIISLLSQRDFSLHLIIILIALYIQLYIFQLNRETRMFGSQLFCNRYFPLHMCCCIYKPLLLGKHCFSCCLWFDITALLNDLDFKWALQPRSSTTTACLSRHPTWKASIVALLFWWMCFLW